MKYIQVEWTAPTMEEAKKICGILLELKLVACAHLCPIESLFVWKNVLEEQKEIKVVFKSKDVHFEQIKKTILENASYEVPEILKLPILEGNQSYLRWLDEVLAK